MKSQQRVSCPLVLLPSLRWLASTLSGVVFWTAPFAFAQEAEADPTVQSPSPSEVVITDKARSHFRAGVNLLQDPDGARYEEAYRQFKAAYAESPSWKILGNLGVSAMKLEKDGEAMDAFSTYLSEGGDEVTEQERAQFQRDIETLKASVATIRIAAQPAALTLVDERVTHSGGSIRNRYDVTGGATELRIRAGHHKITARAPGYEEAVWEFDASASESLTHSFELQPPAAQPADSPALPADTGTYRPIPLGVWIGAGVTGALAVGAVSTGIVALGKNSKYQDANDAGDGEAADLRDQVKTFNLVTDVLIGASVVSAAVTTVVFLTRPSKPRPTAWQLTPSAGPDGGALLLSGSF